MLLGLILLEVSALAKCVACQGGMEALSAKVAVRAVGNGNAEMILPSCAPPPGLDQHLELLWALPQQEESRMGPLQGWGCHSIGLWVPLAHRDIEASR